MSLSPSPDTKRSASLEVEVLRFFILGDESSSTRFTKQVLWTMVLANINLIGT